MITTHKDQRKPGNREKLLLAAQACLRDTGYARTTARDLVAESGTNLNSIGYHFGSKDGLMSEAIAAGFEEWMADVERSAFAEDAADSVERLQRLLQATIDRFEELRPFLVAFVEAFPPAVRSDGLRDRMASAYDDVRRAGADMVQRAVEIDGVDMSREHAETLASLITAACDGFILQWLLEPRRVPTSDQVMAALAAAGPAVTHWRGR
ncbi:MAG: TetR/AcrR family transcriptional regulator [Solirubrobacterales bacterium]